MSSGQKCGGGGGHKISPRTTHPVDENSHLRPKIKLCPDTPVTNPPCRMPGLAKKIHVPWVLVIIRGAQPFPEGPAIDKFNLDRKCQSWLGSEKSAPKLFRPKFSCGCPRGMSIPKRFCPGFGDPDRSVWPDVRRDIRPKTSSLG